MRFATLFSRYRIKWMRQGKAMLLFRMMMSKDVRRNIHTFFEEIKFNVKWCKWRDFFSFFFRRASVHLHTSKHRSGKRCGWLVCCYVCAQKPNIKRIFKTRGFRIAANDIRFHFMRFIKVAPKFKQWESHFRNQNNTHCIQAKKGRCWQSFVSVFFSVSLVVCFVTD